MHSRKQKCYDSGKKRKHTLKTQVVVERETGIIVCTEFDKEKQHNFRLFKQNLLPLKKQTLCLVDKGYQGIQKYHYQSQTLHKKRRKQPLS
jgi:hypothetical protein